MASLDDSNDRLEASFDFKTPLYFHAAQKRKRARLIDFRGLCPLSFTCASANRPRTELPNEIDSRSTHGCFAASLLVYSSEYTILGP